jgi:hypothetical protein
MTKEGMKMRCPNQGNQKATVSIKQSESSFRETEMPHVDARRSSILSDRRIDALQTILSPYLDVYYKVQAQGPLAGAPRVIKTEATSDFIFTRYSVLPQCLRAT